MTRVNVYHDGQLAGWYDPQSATRYDADTRWDGHNNIDVNTGSQWDHQALYRTAGGRWVLHAWSNSARLGDSSEFLAAEDAREWLLTNHQDQAVTEHFGPVEAERGGRPEVGPPINTRLAPETLAKVDEEAVREGVTRAEMIRRLVDDALTARAV